MKITQKFYNAKEEFMKCGVLMFTSSILALVSMSVAQSNDTVDANIAVVKRFYEEYTAGHPEVILEIHPETITMHYADSVDEVPTQVLYEDLKALKEANPDLHAEIYEIFGVGDIVVTNFTWTTTHTGDYFSIPATGTTTLHNGIVVRRLQDGKIIESWEMFDDLAFMNSIGYVPSWDELIANGPLPSE